MKATLDHIGIAVGGLDEALAFYRDALGLEVSTVHEVPGDRVRTVFVPVGESSLELLEATEPGFGHRGIRRPPRARTASHHAGGRGPDGGSDPAQGTRRPPHRRRAAARRGRLARGVRPSVGHGRRAARAERTSVGGRSVAMTISRLRLGRLELVPVLDGYFALDGGAMFGVVPKPLWEKVAPPDPRNRIPAGDARLAGAGRGASDPDRRRRRRQGRCEGRGYLRVRSGASPRPLARRSRRRAGRDRAGRRLAPALRSRRRLHGARERRARGAALSARALLDSPRRVRRCHPPARAQSRELLRRELRAAHRGRGRGLRGGGRGGGARPARPPDRRPHDAPPDRGDRVGGARGHLRGGSAADGRARAAPLDHGLRPVSDGYPGLQTRVPARSRRPGVPDLVRARPDDRGRLHAGGRWQDSRRAGDVTSGDLGISGSG